MRRDAAECDRLISLRQQLSFAECKLFWELRLGATSKLALQHPYSDNDLPSFAMQLPHLRKYKNDQQLPAMLTVTVCQDAVPKGGA